MSNFSEQAVERVNSYFKNYDTDQPAEIIADIVHYCQQKGINFYDEVELAVIYVSEELSYDAEFAE